MFQTIRPLLGKTNARIRVPPQLCRSLTNVGGSTINEKEVEKFNNSDWWGGSTSNVGPLHAMQPVRLGIIKRFLNQAIPEKPLHELRILDIGCGGGLLSESLARSGANVTGIDANPKNIEAARSHLQPDIENKISYRCATAEELIIENEVYDVVCALEVIEHVNDQPLFLKSCASLVKPGGVFALSTMGKTWKSFALSIIAAEYVTGMVPPGTHDWNKFMRHEQVEDIIHEHKLNTHEVVGMIYNPFVNTWHESSIEVDVNYMLLATK